MRAVQKNNIALQTILSVLGLLQVINIHNCYGDYRKIDSDKKAFEQLSDRVATDVALAYKTSRFSSLSKDYFFRFSRDPNAKPQKNETLVNNDWKIIYSANAEPLTGLMVGYLIDFFNRQMDVDIASKQLKSKALNNGIKKAIILDESGGGDPNVPQSFTIKVTDNIILIQGVDYLGLRDGIVKLVDIIGFREAPILTVGEQIYRPRISIRAGVIPWMGSCRDLVFAGYNAQILTADKNPLTFGKVYGDQLSLYSLSKSNAIPELKYLRDPDALQKLVRSAREARRHGLKVYCLFNTFERFPKDHPVFKAHPDIIGTLTWNKDGDYSLCTEHPLVIQYLTETVREVFKEIGLDGVAIIVGAESFYHCYTFPYGAQLGHTTCPRCEKLGAETVVSNLCHHLLDAARQSNPQAQILAWPYQAYPWSSDANQIEFIRRLKPGMGILTEVVNREVIEKPEGLKKIIFDYSIDPIGPGKRAVTQIKACHDHGIPIFIKSEPELSFEAPALPHVPCLDRRIERAEALATSGIEGVWIFPYFKPCYGTSSMESHKFFWWDPAPDKEQFLQKFAARLAGERAGPYLKKAWEYTSEAVDWSPEIYLPHYVGPYYLGPAHPMCADPEAKLPEIFYGNYLFHIERGAAEALKQKPLFDTSPCPSGADSSTESIPLFGRFYKRMTESLAKAVKEIETAEPFVEQRHRLTFDAETLPIRWFYHTVRTQANFYESCQLRDQLLALAKKDSRTVKETAQAKKIYNRWRQVLLDEQKNAIDALLVINADVRLDFSLDDALSFPHASDMIDVKIKLINREINEYLPTVAKRCGFNAFEAIER